MTSQVDIIDDAPEPGDTFTLTAEGWQRVEYAEPERGWHLRSDGSWESPDGQTRTWPLDAPMPLDAPSEE
jgi:hypothetical protein